MKITVFGSTGKTGRLVVERALAKGHAVTAFARDPDRLTQSHTNLRVVQGSLDQPETVNQAIADSEAVISAMGSGHGTLTSFAKILVPAMSAVPVRRLVSLVGAGVAVPGDPKTFGRTFMLGLMRLVARHVLEDASEHARLIMSSDLDWTLVRPPRLVDGVATGSVRHAPTMALGPSQSITRADLAGFMLELAEADSYLREAPMVANT